jgi:hypothetical protein
MNINKILKNRLEVVFAPLNKRGAEKTFPPPYSLSTALEKLLPTTDDVNVQVEPHVATLFATAAVEMWLRAVHSFLVSASVTKASPIWASATGYYASHYSIRALAHLLGHFQLFRRKRIVHLDLQNGQLICAFDSKQAKDREHRLYWKLVKRDTHFRVDPLFTENEPDLDASDVGHRDRANYADHLFQFPSFSALDEAVLKARVQFISQIEFTTPPIPQRSRFPDIESVQVIAYHRIVRFRQFLDEVLGGSNRFWGVHRSPGWASELIDFQLTEQGGLASLKN